jgi:TolB-like protein/tetratricopeptide (TPR) repeat protein
MLYTSHWIEPEAALDKRPEDAPKAAGPTPDTVFLSYSHEDEKRARPIIQVLEQAGFSVWWDGKLGGGERFSRIIETALEGAKAVVVLWSQNSVVSGWVQDEAARGRDRHCLVPLSIDGCEPPLGFRQFHVIDLSHAKARTDSPEMQNLIRAVSALHAATPLADAAPAKSPGLNRRVLLGGGATLAVIAGGLAAWKSGMLGAGRPPAGSIAVLPFRNISGDPDQAYFSDGLSAEVRAELARNAQLQVAAQASSNVFRDRTEDAKSISSKLGVSYLLDGNVRRSGDTVRVVAELIEGRSGFDRWSQTFERPIADVFAVQSEIAGAVAGAIFSAVTTSTPAPGRNGPTRVGGTTNAAAYDSYLRGKDLFSLGIDEKSDRAALALFDAAIGADPNYGAAHAARSRSLATLANVYAQGGTRRALYDEAVVAANRAVTLAPELADAQSALGFALFSRLEVRNARQPYDRSKELGAGDADVLNRFALYCARTGRFDDARAAITRATALDPLNARVFWSVGAVEYAARRYSESIPPVQRALALNPKLSSAWAAIGASQLLLGKIDAAGKSFAAEPSSLFGLPGIAIVAQRQGNPAEAQAALARLVQEHGDNSLYQQAEVYAQWGDRDKALAALRDARADFDSGLILVRNDPLLDPLRMDAEFLRLLQDLGFA